MDQSQARCKFETRTSRRSSDYPIIVAQLDAGLLIHLFLTRQDIAALLANAHDDDCLYVNAPGLRLEVSVHDDDTAVTRAARTLGARLKLALAALAGRA
jgi:hypothetical protein